MWGAPKWTEFKYIAQLVRCRHKTRSLDLRWCSFPVLRWELISFKDSRCYHHPETLEGKKKCNNRDANGWRCNQKFQIPNIGRQEDISGVRRPPTSLKLSSVHSLLFCLGRGWIFLNGIVSKCGCCEREAIFSEVHYAMDTLRVLSHYKNPTLATSLYQIWFGTILKY